MDRAALKYAESHEWVALDGDVATIGITDFAVQALTDLVYIALPQVGRTLQHGEVLGEVESVKAVSDLYAPVSGTVLEVNTELPNNLQWLSDDPFGKGWIMKLKLAPGATTDQLLDQAAYQKFCDAAGH